MAVAALMVGSGIVGGFILAPAFGALLIAYTVVTLSYSLWFKRVAMLDVALLAGLYGLRLGMGAVLASAAFSEWLMVFAIFFFLSLSLAKRHVEIVKAAAVMSGPIKGRGYNTGDAVLTLPLGLAAAMTSLLVMVLFLVFAALIPGATYANPKFLWGTPPLVFLWMSRVWLLAARGELEDDPVSFAVKDRVSLFLGALLGVFTLLAVLDFPF
jgi:4-hydroxybenzoate polyprenyltransferase